MISYKDPGKYAAVCIHADGKSHYVKMFSFPKPEEREDPALGGFACPPGVDASWYYLNRVDPVGWVEAVYPVGIFKELVLGGWEEVPVIPVGANVRPARFGPGDIYE